MVDISVIVPCYNSEKTLSLCLSAIRKSKGCSFELIVVDDGSEDKTRIIAEEFADRIITHGVNRGMSQARNSGFEAATGKIYVNIDSDVRISENHLALILDCFNSRPDVDALSGKLSPEHPYENYFSRYKNGYMDFIFKSLPETITFLYGSIHAFRREVYQPYREDLRIANDTEMGMRLVSDGKKIIILKDLEVVHYKRHSLRTLVRNDFRVPFDWARIFILNKNWKCLGRHRTGFAHASKSQLLSVCTGTVLAGLFISGFFFPELFWICAILSLIWARLNYSFLAYLKQQFGSVFLVRSIIWTLADQIIMAAGIGSGIFKAVYSDLRSAGRPEERSPTSKVGKPDSTQGHQSAVEMV